MGKVALSAQRLLLHICKGEKKSVINPQQKNSFRVLTACRVFIASDEADDKE